jgi:hypothetical protein
LPWVLALHRGHRSESGNRPGLVRAWGEQKASEEGATHQCGSRVALARRRERGGVRSIAAGFPISAALRPGDATSENAGSENAGSENAGEAVVVAGKSWWAALSS